MIDPKVACVECKGETHIAGGEPCQACDFTGYKSETHVKFCQDMRGYDIDVRFYRGRNFYAGPAAEADSISDIMSKTTVKCNYDTMGEGYIVYPR